MKKTRVLFDHQIFEMQKIGGASRCFVELIENLNHTEKLNISLSLKNSSNEYLVNSGFASSLKFDPLPQDLFLGGMKFKGVSKLFKFKNWMFDSMSNNKKFTIDLLQKQNFDVFHPTYYDDYFLPYLGNKPFVITVHDMIHEIYPEHFPLSDTTAKLKRVLVQKASKVIAVSESTKKDIIDFYGTPSDKIRVVHWAGASSAAKSLSTNAFSKTLPSRYLLYVGARSGYKNFYFFVNAISDLLRSDRSLNLVCTWMGFDQDEVNFFRQIGIESQIHHLKVKDDELGELYRNAKALVFPSLYEGFGLPILEAFSNSCPVIVSNTSSLTEIAGKAALHFNPKDTVSIKDAVNSVVFDESLSRQLVGFGLERLNEFSWSKTANNTANVYDEVIHG